MLAFASFLVFFGLNSAELLRQQSASQDSIRQEYARLFEQAKSEASKGDNVKASSDFSTCADLADKIPDDRLTSDALHQLGNALEHQGKRDDAIACYQRWKIVAQRLVDDSQVSWSLHDIGITYVGEKNWIKAYEFLKQAFVIRARLKDPLPLASTEFFLGVAANEAGKIEEAALYCDQAAKLYEQLKMPAPLSRALFNLGLANQKQNRLSEVIDPAKRSLAIATDLHDLGLQLQNLNMLGDTYDWLGETDQSIAEFKAALTLYEQNSDQFGTATTVNRIGGLYWNLGDFNTSLQYDLRSLSLATRFYSADDVAFNQLNLGICYFDLSDYDQALEYLNRSLDHYLSTKNQPQIATCFNNIGLVYRQLGQSEKALSFLNRALTIRRDRNDKLGIANSLHDIGVVYDDMQRYDLALPPSQESLKFREEDKYPMYLSDSLTDLGDVYIHLGKFDKAINLQNRSLDIRQKLRQPWGIALALGRIGDAYVGLRDFPKALDYDQRSLAIREKAGNPYDIALAESSTANVFARLHRTEEAIQTYENAVRHFEGVSQQVQDGLDLAEFQSTEKGLYSRFARVLAEHGEVSRALEIAERGRGQGLARQSGLNEADLGPKLGEDLQPYLRARRAAATATKLAVLQESKLESATEAEKPQLETISNEYKQRADSAQRIFDALRLELYERHPDFKRIAGASPPRLDDLVALARRNPDTLYLEYADSPEGLMLFGLHGTTRIRYWRIEGEGPSLDRLVSDYMSSIQTSSVKERRLAGELFGRLVGPVAQDGLLNERAIRHIVFVPDGPLSWIPPAALLMPDGKRLIERFGVSSAVSLGVLLWPENVRIASHQTLVVADTCHDVSADQVSAVRGGHFGPLPGAQKEGVRVFGMFPDSRLLVGHAAAKAKVEQAMPSFERLHFACHCDVNSKHAMYSALVLAPDSAKPNEQFMTATEVMGLPLAARLVVLSGCDTAKGVLRGGEGLMGLAWAFRAAGCPAVVASKWTVDDESARRIMVSFYEGLKHGARKDDALRTAMLAEMKRFHPGKASGAYYWAAFQLIGDSAPLPNKHLN